MSREWAKFDPNGVGLKDAGIFGLPFTPEEAQVVLIPAPWGVTTSYGGGTYDGPRAILNASPQIDYYHPSYGSETWKVGISMLPLAEWNDAYEEGKRLRKDAEAHIGRLEHGQADVVPEAINDACEKFHTRVENTASELVQKGKLVGLVGGDHSTPLGLMRALAKKHGEFGILQVDAHCDLRDSYEGFTYSHASIMHNALKIKEVKKLVQVGIRDYSIGEYEIIEKSEGRIKTFFDADLQNQEILGKSWGAFMSEALAVLPESVYLSFDIDGLNPSLCPNTGTPVPGGLSFQQAMYVIESVAKSGKTIIGFDLNEVTPGEDEWDANVGMRVLWNLCMWSAFSNRLRPLS
jgi:agmatinase